MTAASTRAGALLLSVSLGLVLTAAAQQQAPTFAITHITVIDATGAPAKPDMTVVITGKRITSIGAATNVVVPRGAKVVDGKGRYLIPGLWDMHVHLFSKEMAWPAGPGISNKDWFFPLFVANGVTGVRDMHTDPGEIKLAAEWNQQRVAGRMIGPAVAVSSRMVDGERPTSGALEVTTAAEARQAVKDLKEGGAAFIKVGSNLSREAYFAIADETKKQHIPFAGHVSRAVSVWEATDAGQQTIEHLDGIPGACSSQEAEWLKRGTRPPRAVIIATYDSKRCEELAERLARNGTWVVPTDLGAPGVYASEGGSLNDPRLKYVPRWMLEHWKMTADWRMLTGQVRRDDEDDARRIRAATVAAMRAAHVHLLTGTDTSPSRISFPGFSLHDELNLRVRQGLSTEEALETVTRNPAVFFGSLNDSGTVERGKLADLVLLDANPLTDIRNVSKIHAVVLNGTLLDRAKLDQLLAQVETAVQGQ
jgi:Amidohydrolase family